MKQKHAGCEIEDFVERPIYKLCVIFSIERTIAGFKWPHAGEYSTTGLGSTLFMKVGEKLGRVVAHSKCP